MRVIVLTILLLSLNFPRASGQCLIPNTCDSTVLTAEEWEKCRRDTFFTEHLLAVINYSTYLKTEVLPAFRKERKKLLLPPAIRADLDRLKAIYDSTLQHRITVIAGDMDRNQMFVQPKAYLSSLVALELFRAYPDVYSVLFNPIFFQLRPKADLKVVAEAHRLTLQIYHAAPATLKELALSANHDVLKKSNAYPQASALRLFQGDKQERSKEQYFLVNYLLWTE